MSTTNVIVLCAFAFYMAIMILIGAVNSRNTKNNEDYFLGGRGLGAWTAGISAEASDMSGWLLMGLPGTFYLAGSGDIWIAIGLLIGTVLNWILVSSRLRRYTIKANNSLTIPSFFDNRFKSNGALKIVSPEPSKNYSVTVDEKPESPNSAGLYLLKPGKHTVSISSDEFRNELRTVLIQRAEVTELSVVLTSVRPAVSVQAPEGTKIFVDGAEVGDISSLELENGDHTFRFVFGGYEVSKKISIQKGKNYTLFPWIFRKTHKQS